MLKIDSSGNKKIEIEIEVEPGKKETISFWIRPQSFEDVVLIRQFIQKYELLESKDGMYDAASYGAILRITEWEGVGLKNGDKAPCTIEARSTLFGKYPAAIGYLMTAIRKAEEDEIKNSNPLQDGRDDTDPTSAKSAETA
jgi:hypothetical protein